MPTQLPARAVRILENHVLFCMCGNGGVKHARDTTDDHFKELLDLLWLHPAFSTLEDIESHIKFTQSGKTHSFQYLTYLASHTNGATLREAMHLCLHYIPYALEERLTKSHRTFTAEHRGYASYYLRGNKVMVKADDRTKLPQGAQQVPLHEMVLSLCKKPQKDT